MFKAIIVSDIHANLPALQSFVKKISMDYDLMINCGDSIGYYTSPNECVEILKELNAKSIIGDHESALLTSNASFMNDFGKQAIIYTKTMIKQEHFDYLKSLKESEMIEIGSKKVLITHSAPGYPIWKELPPGTSANDFNEMFEKSGADIIVMGHTHLPFVKKFKKGLIINPGSAGQPRDGNPSPSYIELTSNGEDIDIELKRFTYNIDEVQRSVFMEGLPSFLSERLYMGI